MTQDEKDALFRAMCKSIEKDMHLGLQLGEQAGRDTWGLMLKFQSDAVSYAAKIVYGANPK